MILFETGRLVVRRYTWEDAGVFFAMNSNEELMRYIRPTVDRAGSDLFLRENLRLYDLLPGMGRWAAVLKETGEVVGLFALLPLADTGLTQLGYLVNKAFWGMGLATELAVAGVRYAASRKLRQVVAITTHDNYASHKVLLKAGFVRDGIYHDRGTDVFKFVCKLAEGR